MKCVLPIEDFIEILDAAEKSLDKNDFVDCCRLLDIAGLRCDLVQLKEDGRHPNVEIMEQA
jgi:hypothetical protein